MQAHRERPLVVVLGLDQAQAEAEAERWRRLGAVVMRARDAGGCLRVATAVGPDRIVLDRRVPPSLIRLLNAHPVSATALIDWLPAADERRLLAA